VLETPFGGAATLSWALAGQSATASSSSDRCTATIELRKVTAPASDPGVSGRQHRSVAEASRGT